MNTIKLVCPTCKTDAEIPRQFVDTQLQFHVDAGKDVRLFILKCPNCMLLENEDVCIARKHAEEMEDELTRFVKLGDWTSIVKVSRKLGLDVEVITQVDCAIMLIKRPLDGMTLAGGKSFIAKLTPEEAESCPINLGTERTEMKEGEEGDIEIEETETEPTATSEPATETSAEDFLKL